MSKLRTRKTLPEFLDQDAPLELLRRANAQLSAQLTTAKAARSELVEAVFQGAQAGAAGLTILPVPAPSVPSKKESATPETAIAVLSDWQLGKRTPTYSTDVCAERITQYAKKLERIVQIERSEHPVNTLHVYLLGDMVEGELIFPGQSWRVDASLYRQVTVDGPQILCGFLRHMLTLFAKVRVVAVIGNHGAIGGRARKEMHPESNADLMLYRIAQQLLAHEERLTWDIPMTEGERSWCAIDKIGSHKFFLFHGDQMRGGSFGGLPFYGFGRAINNWASGVIPEGFNYGVCVTPDTEVLTPTGWRTYDHLLSGVPIAAVSTTGEMQWQEPVVNVLRYSGDLLHYKSTAVDLLVTPDHMMWTHLPGKPWTKRAAKDTRNMNWHTQTAPGAWNGTLTVPELFSKADPLDMASVFGWYLAEGSVADERRLEIAKSSAANPDQYKEIESLLLRLGWTVSRDPNKLRVCNAGVARWFMQEFGTGCDKKHIPSWVREWPRPWLQQLVQSAMDGDGTRSTATAWMYPTTSSELADNLQEVCLKLGWTCNQSSRQRGDDRRRIYELRILLYNERRLPIPSVVSYDGTVWCPTVPTGLWIARRNGKVMVTGNCGHWHQAASIPINNRILWVNGSTESNNEWLREEIKAQCPPSQWLLMVHPKHGVTSERRIWLD
jgi:hypothetical protein